ncbi:hypothetical protein NLJ89_g5301 [Agrocybe chaxingu]|uniref:Uncharacterized protein n=1 Tax=Agrocybe chaxingu TaxID=84603 RepID=A0A9W8K0V7_9AGAR|nr:hypothetical protein NLJ89_g5301 [Agrocybe chaxingu]
MESLIESMLRAALLVACLGALVDRTFCHTELDYTRDNAGASARGSRRSTQGRAGTAAQVDVFRGARDMDLEDGEIAIAAAGGRGVHVNVFNDSSNVHIKRFKIKLLASGKTFLTSCNLIS